MFDPKEKDFAAIDAWGLEKDPLRAISDFRKEQLELRWSNSYQKKAHEVYYQKRLDYIQKKNFDHYYKTAEKPIDRHRWEYLKNRKAWYIAPLEWDRFAAPDVKRVLDLGCGDGDVTQRIADYIARVWREKDYAGHAIEITGYDLNPSRVKNAKEHCRSPHPLITFRFDVCDVVGKGIPDADKHFDYATSTGVFEILEDEPAHKFMAELCRVTAKGVYVEDLADEYPGGYPREDFESLFNTYGYTLLRDHYVLTEPFRQEGSADPMELWPVQKDRLMFAVPKK
ncbi:MAG: class I SAM-dependent methyltransferase [Proteobacteria bacterium]|nr:class I SAM-dependent methyltransferase [Pseudomonadota bacterium]